MVLNNNIFVAFNNETTAKKVAAMLKTGGIYPTCVCHTGASLLSKINNFDDGVIVCGTKFRDTMLFDILDYIPDYFQIVVIGSIDSLDDIMDTRVFKLSTPLNRSDLIYSVGMLMNLDNHHFIVHNRFRTKNEEMIIQQAKGVLIHKYHMSEEQAHRYMQTKSMNTGEKMITIARLILN